MKQFFLLIITLFTLTTLQHCKKAEVQSKIDTPIYFDTEWAKDANIYEVNIRQYTEEGTFDAFTQHLPRLKNMGVKILWLMPIQEISKAKRKGTLGSYYSVSDYTKTNPEFGTMQDFDEMVQAIHALDMKIILDWVPNHTGWDHPWITEHPDYYTKDSMGNITDPINPETGESWGWTDVADLNYENPEMRQAQIDAMKFWVNEHDVDGFRCDVAHGVPEDFWTEVREGLVKVDPSLFMLAEAEVPALRNNQDFIMDYGWEFHHIMNDIAKGEKTVREIDFWLGRDKTKYEHGYHMHFTSNHDENSWAGTVLERMGDGHLAFAVLVSTFDGMPLIYGGQEEPLERRLEFFEKDNIEFGDYEYEDFYTRLLDLKRNNKALWNGEYGGPLIRINDHKQVYAFSREKDGEKVVVVLNLSDAGQKTILTESFEGYRNVFTDGAESYSSETELSLEPWEYRVYSSK